MNLYILRHGLAVEPEAGSYENDAARPLTPKGKRKLKRIGRAMKALELSFDLILSSPYVRARQTAEIVAEALKAAKRLEFSSMLTPDGSPKKLITYLQAEQGASEDVLLVGHEPYLSSLIALLISDHASARVELKKGALCKMAAESLKAGRCATLEWL